MIENVLAFIIILLLAALAVCVIALIAVNKKLEDLETTLNRSLMNVNNSMDGIDMRVYRCESLIDDCTSYISRRKK